MARTLNLWGKRLFSDGIYRKSGMSLLLLAGVFICYFPAFHGGFLWDDDIHISDNLALRSLKGLWKIWLLPGATCQYYPLTFSVWWVGFHVWGLNPLGFHLFNALLHGIAAILLWRLLLCLRLRGALLGAAIFALHPVNVMSVAWMTELKNTLSGSLALAAALAYVRAFELGAREDVTSTPPVGRIDTCRWSWYLASLALFLLAMCAKTAVAFLPVSILLILWWQQAQIRPRDMLGVLPMFAIAAGMGVLTISIERHAGGASGAEFRLNGIERLLVSGRSFWFYLGSFVCPWRMPFIHERWAFDARSCGQYLHPLAAAAVLIGAWIFRRRIGRGLFTGLAHYYLSTSALVLVVTLYMMRYSFVSQHWQYFGTMSASALAGYGVTRIWERAGRYGFVLPLVLLLGLGLLTRNQSRMYTDAETLWRTTIAISPNSWMAHDNLGNALSKKGRFVEATMEHRRALELQPDSADTYNNLANTLMQSGEIEGAIYCYNKSLDINSDNASTHYNLGNLLLHKTNRLDEAQSHLERSVEIENRLKLKTGNFYAYYDLGLVYEKHGRFAEAVQYYRKALAMQPQFSAAQNKLAWALATCVLPSVRDGAEAVRLAIQSDKEAHGQNPGVLRILAAAHAENGNFPEAIDTAQRALAMARMYSEVVLAGRLVDEIALYQAKAPLREASPQ